MQSSPSWFYEVDRAARSRAAFYAACFRGTFAPFLRAFERPMAMACLRLFTRLPCFFFLKCRISVRTSLDAFLPYFLPPPFLRAILRCSFSDGILPSNRDAGGFGQV